VALVERTWAFATEVIAPVIGQNVKHGFSCKRLRFIKDESPMDYDYLKCLGDAIYKLSAIITLGPTKNLSVAVSDLCSAEKQKNLFTRVLDM